MFVGTTQTVKISVSRGKRSEIQEVQARLLFGGLLVVFVADYLAGKIGIPYWENQLRHQLRRLKAPVPYSQDVLIYQVFPDAYTALRQTLHILFENYGRSFTTRGEKQRLQQALRTHARVNEYFLGLRKSTYEQVAQKIQTSVENILAQIGVHPRDIHKRRALGKLVEAGKVRDSRGRVNPYAKIPQVDASRLEVEDRISNIMAIEPRIVARRQALKTLIELGELKFRAMEHFLIRLLPHLTAAYFSEHDDAVLRRKVTYHLARLADDLGQMEVRPFVLTGQRIREEVREAVQLIEAGKFSEVQQLLSTSLASLKLRVLRTDMENFITQLTQLLFRLERPLLPAEIQRIRNSFKNMRARLATIDERRFKKRVCRKALSLVSEAEQLLRGTASKRVEYLEPVRRKLVEAAQLL